MGKQKTVGRSVGRPSVKKEFEVSKDLRDLADEVVKKENLHIDPAKVEFLLVYPYISKSVLGRCIKTGKELKFFSKFDYLIEMSGEVWDSLKPDVQHILMYHELLHIMPVMNDKTGDWDFKIRDHDIQDFAAVVKKYGIDWVDNVKTTASSVYDLDPKDVDALTL